MLKKEDGCGLWIRGHFNKGSKGVQTELALARFLEASRIMVKHPVLVRNKPVS